MRTEADKQILIQLGNKIKTMRIEKGFNQTEFANLIGKDQPSLNRLETGKINPGYLYLIEIARGLDLTINELL
jgi:putative transcriptional regulator